MNTILKICLFSTFASLFFIPTKAQNVEEMEKLAFAAFKAGQYDEAIAHFKKIVEKQPRNRFAQFNIGYSLDNLKRYEEAIEFYKNAIEIEPFYLRAILNVANNSKIIGNYEQAIIYFKKALKLDTDKIYIQLDIAECLLAMKAYNDASDMIEKVLKAQPFYSHAIHLKAIYYLKTNDIEMALRKINSAILSIKHRDFLSTRATIYGIKKDYDKAITDLDEAIKMDSTKAIYVYKKALCFLAKDNFKIGSELILKAQQIDSTESYLNSEDSLVKLQQPQSSLVKFELKNCVKNKIAVWQQKGEFETQSDFAQRMNENSQQLQVSIFEANCLEEIKKEYALSINWNLYLKLSAYDAENQTFQIKSKKFGNFVIMVPLQEAPSFKANFNNFTVNPFFDYSVEEDKLVLAKIQFQSAIKNYLFDVRSDNSTSYSIPKIDYNIPPIVYNSSSTSYVAPVNIQKKAEIKTAKVEEQSVDVDIPINEIKNDKTFVVIIANEKYDSEVEVAFALNDGRIVKEYCMKTLGIPAQNIGLYENATYGNMKKAIKWITDITMAFKGEANVIFYYAGHGMPNEADRSAYLLPSDGTSYDYDGAIKVEDLIAKLGKTPTKQVTVLLDACFSGSIRDNGMLAQARGVKIKPKVFDLQNNIVVFSASQGEESAFPYSEKKHGLFTYFLLKKLQESKGNLNYDELHNYIQTNVKQHSLIVNKKSQTPQVMFPKSISETWKKWNLY